MAPKKRKGQRASTLPVSNGDVDTRKPIRGVLRGSTGNYPADLKHEAAISTLNDLEADRKMRKNRFASLVSGESTSLDKQQEKEEKKKSRGRRAEKPRQVSENGSESEIKKPTSKRKRKSSRSSSSRNKKRAKRS